MSLSPVSKSTAYLAKVRVRVRGRGRCRGRVRPVSKSTAYRAAGTSSESTHPSLPA